MLQSQAQSNDRRAERSATGVYKGKLATGTRTRKLPGGPEVSRISGGQGKLKVPIKDGKLKTSLKDSQLDGSNKAVLKGREKKSTVKRQGKKIAYLAIGEMDVFGDGHNPYKHGVIKGPFTLRGSKWVANTTTTGDRIDNDGFKSCYKGKASGKH